MTEREQMLYGDIVVLLLEKREEQLKVLKKINELLCQCGYQDEPVVEAEVEVNATEVELNTTEVEVNVTEIEPCEPCEPCPVCGSCEPCEHQQPCDACDVCEPQPQPQTEGEVNNG